MEHLSLCKGSVRGTWQGVSLLGTLRDMLRKVLEGEVPILTTVRDRYQKALEMEYFFIQGLHKGH
jgi:hypothetical protein